jgi:hypothetical protein
MKNIQDVLREKETEIEKLTGEVKLLRVAARLLEDESPSPPGRVAEPMSSDADTAIIDLAAAMRRE